MPAAIVTMPARTNPIRSDIDDGSCRIPLAASIAKPFRNTYAIPHRLGRRPSTIATDVRPAAINQLAWPSDRPTRWLMPEDNTS